MILNDLTKLKNLKEMVDYAAENYGEIPFLEYKKDGGIEKRPTANLKLPATHSAEC